MGCEPLKEIIPTWMYVAAIAVDVHEGKIIAESGGSGDGGPIAHGSRIIALRTMMISNTVKRNNR